ncbi:NAD-dependent epimerase/dehydratase family protein [Streptomyces avermitilis]|uniref:NAD-dependent epimerase/dehydratase family protein n=1 Tax=Streptomyces avermitilis TaxID=33903 RepID=UPI0036B40E21
MAIHVVIGAGSIGTNVARLIADRGESVRIVTRSGSGPEYPLVERVAADASDPGRLTELSRGAKVIYHCANPPSYNVGTAVAAHTECGHHSRESKRGRAGNYWQHVRLRPAAWRCDERIHPHGRHWA